MKAPAFELQSFNGDLLNLESFEKPLWLIFFRYASCPFCNLFVAQLIERYREFQDKGIEVAAVFQSDRDSLAKYVGTQNPPFEMICDPEMTIYESYGLKKSWKGMVQKELGLRTIQAFTKGFLPGKMEGAINRLPSDFLIDSNNQIVFRYDGQDISDHVSIDTMLLRAEQLLREQPAHQ